MEEIFNGLPSLDDVLTINPNVWPDMFGGAGQKPRLVTIDRVSAWETKKGGTSTEVLFYDPVTEESLRYWLHVVNHNKNVQTKARQKAQQLWRACRLSGTPTEGSLLIGRQVWIWFDTTMNRKTGELNQNILKFSSA